ncbi:MAG: protein kinase, partial [Lentisphaeria bacterium]|nr:protein kinase [Lentisphaeria bacterium]
MRFQCHKCKGIVAIDDSEFGKPVGCGHCQNVTMVPESRFSKGAVVNDFVIQDVLGTGGMGKVYLAYQISLDRPVALKILLEKYAEEKEFIIDFIKEARAAARLNHPNIVQSYAVGAEEGIYFFAMEYVEGTTLKDVRDQRQKLPWREAF